MILKIFLVLALLVIGFLLVAAMRPADFRYSRSVRVAAPPAVLFAQINDLRKFQNWNPWATVDPSSKMTYEGPATGVDSGFSWAGNKDVGEGTMTITETQPDALVRCRMDFKKPMAATNIAEFTFVPEGDQTRVTWSMSGQNGLIAKAFGLIVNCDKMVGDQFEKGLATLKALAEASASKTASTNPSTQTP